MIKKLLNILIKLYIILNKVTIYEKQKKNSQKFNHCML